MLETILHAALMILAICGVAFAIVTLLCLAVAFIWITAAELRDKGRKKDEK